MEHRLKAKEWTNLTAPERASRCLSMAAEAQQLSMQADLETRLHLAKIAQNWLDLAAAIERDYFSQLR